MKTTRTWLIAAAVVAIFLAQGSLLDNQDQLAEEATAEQLRQLAREARAERTPPPIHLSMPIANFCTVDANKGKKLCQQS